MSEGQWEAINREEANLFKHLEWSRIMLILSRRRNETIIIDGEIRITILDIRGGQIRLGIVAPHHVGVYREELCIPVQSIESDELSDRASS